MGIVSFIRGLSQGGETSDDGKVDRRASSLLFWAECGDTERCRKLLEEGAPVDARGFVRESGYDENETPLHKAVSNGHVECARLLISHGADVNARRARDWTPLLLAAYISNMELCRLLLDNGADPNLGNGVWTPLKLACQRANAELVELLLERGADPNVVCGYIPKSAMGIALEEGYGWICDILVRYGALDETPVMDIIFGDRAKV